MHYEQPQMIHKHLEGIPICEAHATRTGARNNAA